MFVWLALHGNELLRQVLDFLPGWARGRVASRIRRQPNAFMEGVTLSTEDSDVLTSQKLYRKTSSINYSLAYSSVTSKAS